MAQFMQRSTLLSRKKGPRLVTMRRFTRSEWWWWEKRTFIGMALGFMLVRHTHCFWCFFLFVLF